MCIRDSIRTEHEGMFTEMGIKIKVEVIVSKISVDAVVDAAKKALYTGHIGDGDVYKRQPLDLVPLTIAPIWNTLCSLLD